MQMGKVPAVVDGYDRAVVPLAKQSAEECMHACIWREHEHAEKLSLSMQGLVR